MNTIRIPGLRPVLRAALLTGALSFSTAHAQTTVPPDITDIRLEAGRPVVSFQPFPATVEYELLLAGTPDGEFVPHETGSFTGFEWTGDSLPGQAGFFRVNARTLTTDELLATTLLHRIAYGPTPDELDRVRAIGPAAYLAEQLAPETITENLDTVDSTPRWVQVKVTGTATSSRIYIYLDGEGDAYLDDLRLVAGTTDDGTQPNLLRNGEFEAALTTGWTVSPNLAASAVGPDFVHGGEYALHLVSSEEGSTQASSIYQTVSPSLRQGDPYTLSYWYLTSGEDSRLTIRLSGRGIESEHGFSGSEGTPGPLHARLVAATAELEDLRAWHVLHAIQSSRQLLEVTRQFLENHFVTEFSKTRDYFDGRGYSSVESERLAVRTEFVENRRWREALLKPQVTFLDLLRISAESPAMIIYLDTVSSRGDGRRIANENYARELCELFCFGVDNGYDQQDIVEISKAWTGWRLELVNPEDEFNPFAARSTNYLDPTLPAADLNDNDNVRGVWSLKYFQNRHNNGAKYLFYQTRADGTPDPVRPKTVPARFGPHWAGKSYGLTIPARQGNAGMQDGYDILAHMADQPFTMEYLTVKLCRLLVHDGFAHGYDFSDAVSTPEEDLVYQGMVAWDSTTPKGQLREVLRVILDSDLFRDHAGSLQKVKTPLEFAVSTIRALRQRNDDGSFTAETDGFGLYDVMNRAGRMRLFDRAEPDGYPEDAPGWISAGTLTERIRFVQSALMPAGMSGKSEAGLNTRIDPVAVLRHRLPPAQHNDAASVAGLFTGLLFPAEGRANLAAYREVAMVFLDTADDGVAASPFAALAPGSQAHDQRVRGMVALLMSTQRFQEQ